VPAQQKRRVPGRGERQGLPLRTLVGAGDRISLFTLPVVVTGVALNILYPSNFAVGGPPAPLRAVSIVLLAVGVVVWAWSVVLIVGRVPRHELITTGPYALVKHPLYTAVALLVLPWLGFLVNTWLGALIGIVLYAASRRFTPVEEAELARTFGPAWDAYAKSVKIRWL
jgi:protein-S-isoprenylcysteine O-methyltransferase Ste14